MIINLEDHFKAAESFSEDFQEGITITALENEHTLKLP
jgi:hypothetical protein